MKTSNPINRKCIHSYSSATIALLGQKSCIVLLTLGSMSVQTELDWSKYLCSLLLTGGWGYTEIHHIEGTAA